MERKLCQPEPKIVMRVCTDTKCMYETDKSSNWVAVKTTFRITMYVCNAWSNRTGHSLCHASMHVTIRCPAISTSSMSCYFYFSHALLFLLLACPVIYTSRMSCYFYCLHVLLFPNYQYSLYYIILYGSRSNHWSFKTPYYKPKLQCHGELDMIVLKCQWELILNYGQPMQSWSEGMHNLTKFWIKISS